MGTKLVSYLISKIRKIRVNKNKKREEQVLINGIEDCYKKLTNRYELSFEQEKEIKSYFKDLAGVEIPTNWHKYFYSRTGIYSKKYLPKTFSSSLISLANKREYRDAYADKNILDVILPNVPHPEILMKNMNGYYYVGNKAVTREEAIAHCSNLGNVIIKPSLAKKGIGVRVINIENGITNFDKMTVSQLFDKYEKNFCIQKIVQQHEKMAALNPTSVNTIRILTYRSGMDILVLYTVIRIGRYGEVIDNESAGGISAIINKDGTLGKYAYGNPGDDKLEKTDSGIILEGYGVPSYKEAVELVKRQHYYLPFFDIVGWDIAVGIDGTPIMIEWNVSPGLSQSANGPAFGEYTERVISEILSKHK